MCVVICQANDERESSLIIQKSCCGGETIVHDISGFYLEYFLCMGGGGKPALLNNGDRSI